ncbi:MAG: hypothetical protein GF418_16620 [Chitinivibrionales bacterium]|nr:hypothetical protein [Chitinivibrionales bacterium]MBD3397246.1 hypothetical protein [Chitinivibrionales bacterium]
MKVLCICPIGIGNYLLVYPACHALKQSRPEYSLHLLGLRLGIAGLAEGDPVWDGVHVFDPTRMGLDPVQRFSIMRSLRRQHFDASLNFFPSNKWLYHLLPLCAGIRRRFGFAYAYSPITTLPFLITDTVPVDTSLHDARQNMNLAALAADRSAIAGQALQFPALFSDTDKKRAGERLSRYGDGPFIGVHPGSSAEHGMILKRWAPERFAALADRMCEKTGAQALILGGAEEDPIKQAVADAMHAPCRVVEQASLRETAALLNECILCLCNDSGLMHIASCGGVPTAAIFGPTDEKRNGPLGQGSLVIRKHMPGFPLWTADTAGDRTVPKGIDPGQSLDALTVDDAWEQVMPWLERIRAAT